MSTEGMSAGPPKAESRKGGRHVKNRDKNKDKGGKGRGVVYCPGFSDEYGIWNNGFSCPKWGDPGEQYCCGSSTKRYCCPQPEPIEPVDYNKHIPLIAGVSAAVAILAVVLISCFLCRCCPGYKRIKRTRPTSQNSQTREVQCRRCNQTTTNLHTSPDMLACGCPVNGPPGSHHHHGRPESLVHSSDLMLTLLESQNAPWHPNHEELNEHPMEDPPPYCETDSTGLVDNLSSKSINSDDEQTPLHDSFRLSNPNLLCMSTFRPLSPTPSSPTSMTSPSSLLFKLQHDMGPHSPSYDVGPHSPSYDVGQHSPSLAVVAGQEAEYSKRDSGCIEDQQDQEEQDIEFDDHDASIVVPKFNFQSLTLCRSLNNPSRKSSKDSVHPIDSDIYGTNSTLSSPWSQS